MSDNAGTTRPEGWSGEGSRRTPHADAVVPRDVTGDVRDLLWHLPDGVVFLDREWRMTYANQQARIISDLQPEQLNSSSVWEQYPTRVGGDTYEAYHRVMAGGAAETFETYTPLVQKWLRLHVTPITSGIAVVFQDISALQIKETERSSTAGRLAQVLDATTDGVVSLDREWRLTYLNRRAEELLYPKTNLLGKNLWAEFPDAISDGSPFLEHYHRAMDQRLSSTFEAHYPEPLNKDLRMECQPSPEGLVVFFRDVTEEKRAQKELRKSEERYRLVTERSPQAVWTGTAQGQVDYANHTFLEYLGDDFTLGDGSTWLYAFAEDDRERVVAEWTRSVTTGEEYSIEARLIRGRDGAERWWHVKASPARDSEGAITAWIGTGLDIHDRLTADKALQASEERYRIVTELSPQSIFTAGAQGHVTYANRRFMEYVGAFDPAMGAEWMKAIDPRDGEATRDAWAAAMRSGNDLSVEARLIRKETGESRWWYIRASPMRDANGDLLQWIGTATDVQEQHLAVEELERERAEMEAVYQTAPVGLLLVDPKELRYLRVNDLQAERMGAAPKEILGKRVADMVVSPIAVENLRRAAGGEVIRDYTYETEFVTNPGDARTMNVNYSPVYGEDGTVRAISIAALDVTQLRKAEKALMQSEKLAAVGRLASSISHEINNPLEAITNLLYLAMADEGLPATAREYVRSAQEELVRVSQIATQTLRFHRQANSPTKVTARQLVDAVLRLYQGRLLNSGIEVDAQYRSETQILCFENDLRQVLNNLIGNAIDAMRTGGRLLVRAHDAAKRDGHPEGIRIAIADTGTGMSAETQQRLFEAFYTTKDLNGTGLGLWISQEIVQRHGGKLSLRSREGGDRHGTVFNLFLPCKE